MRRLRQDQEQVIRSLLARLGERTGEPTEAELRRAARLAAGEGRAPQERQGSRARPWRPLRLRWAAAVAVALLLATGLGFGVASSLTPASSARSDTVGLGFLPAKGWTVVQSGIPGSAESARAIAANVPLVPGNSQIGLPLTALQSWPPWGIVIVATFRARGDASLDAGFPVGALPLHFADAAPATATEYVLRAGIGGYDVEANITFGSEPTPEMLREAEAQIARLVVAPAAVTIAVRPTIQGHDPLVVYGSVSTGRADEKVTVQFKQCGLYPIQFRDHAEVLTETGGGWSTELGIPTNGTLRAVAGGDISNEVVVKARPDVRLTPHGNRKYEVDIVSTLPFWRKSVLLQRFDRGRRSWVTVRKLVLERTFGPGLIWSTTDRFTVKLPKGVTIRAVLPLDQARPCFIAGYSTLLVTK